MNALDLTVHLEHRVDPRCTRRTRTPHTASSKAAGRSDLAPATTEPTAWPDHEFTD